MNFMASEMTLNCLKPVNLLIEHTFQLDRVITECVGRGWQQCSYSLPWNGLSTTCPEEDIPRHDGCKVDKWCHYRCQLGLWKENRQKKTWKVKKVLYIIHVSNAFKIVKKRKQQGDWHPKPFNRWIWIDSKKISNNLIFEVALWK